MDFKNIYEALKKSDVRATEKKLEKEVLDKVDNNEIVFINQFLSKGEVIDGKKYKNIDEIIRAYKKALGSSYKNDANLQILAPIIAAMIATIEKKK